MTIALEILALVLFVAAAIVAPVLVLVYAAAVVTFIAYRREVAAVRKAD